jgi:Histone methylation protein DOT1
MSFLFSISVWCSADVVTDSKTIVLQILFLLLRLTRQDVFLDVGHGVGNFCLQAAYCTGCEARGIEVVRDRYNISLKFMTELQQMSSQLDANQVRVSRKQTGLLLLLLITWRTHLFATCTLFVQQRNTNIRFESQEMFC